MLIYKCDRCGLIVESRHDMEVIQWAPCIREDTFVLGLKDALNSYGTMEICPQCFSLFKSWMGADTEEETSDGGT